MADVEPTNSGPFRFQMGSYGILHPLGSGGMSSVYRAVHLDTGHEVALKVLPMAKARNATILKRFVAEARSAESLEHPNIVQIYDRGSDDGRYYLVLEYVRGGDLHDYVQHHGPLAAAEAVGLIVQVARGLEYAASRGVIHRDVKPSNLLRTPEGEVKIADLGLAVRPEEEDERVTREGTTVGTVDYMSPEQARDSRATSLQSDIYSLGCTLYYLLTAQPPYPGGDIVEKLTRHARTPAPDVREARPDISPALAAVVLRMMAKQPEDRYGSYADLLAAFTMWDSNASSVALVPIDEDPIPPRPARAEPTPAPAPTQTRPQPQPQATAQSPASTSYSIPELSLASLAPELWQEAAPRSADHASTSRTLPVYTAPRRSPVHEPAEWGGSISDNAWILRCVLIGSTVIAVVIGLDLIFRPLPNVVPPHAPEGSHHRAAGDQGGASIEPIVAPGPGRPKPSSKPDSAPPAAPPSWEEPADPPTIPLPAEEYPPGVRSTYLPTWAHEPVPSEIPGPRTIVRRVPGPEEPGALPSLRQGLDVTKGVVELADVGPFSIDDPRIPGETRLIRSRRGYRAAIRIGTPRIEDVRVLPGVFTLDGRSLILDSLDLVVDVRDLSTHQKALFHGSGFNLTLRNCTVTILNPARARFAFVRADDAEARPSRIRIEDSVIQGDVSPLFELGRGAVEVVSRDSFLAADGPIVRTPDASPQGEHRLYALGSALGCRGPLVDLAGAKGNPNARRLSVRAFDTVFARIAGAGVASLTSGDLPTAALGRLLEWRGAKNMYVGWLGYFSTGPEHMIRVRTLDDFGSTWSAEEGSREQVVEWPATQSVAEAPLASAAPFSPGWDDLFARLPRPRPRLRARALSGFAFPPEATVAAPAEPAPAGTVELAFDANAPESEDGDLGAFLRSHPVKPGGRLRVRASGSGPRLFTPVNLAAGSTVEIIVEAPEAGHPPLVFIPASSSTGAALALEGGTLAISGARFRVDQPTGLESLIRVDDGSLALHRCELTASRALDDPPPRLVDFRAPTTRPRLPGPRSPISGTEDRPACVISECVLATTGQAVRAEAGRGIVAVSRSAIGARGDVFTLVPARVARSRFYADLTLDRCTVATGAAAVRVVAWSGEAPGPDRPWLVSSTLTAYVDVSERSPRESILCRADVEAFAQGQFYWRQRKDAIELAAFAAAGDAPPPSRIRDVVGQWVDLWGVCNAGEVAGPRPGSSSTSVRLAGRPHPGRLAPSDLALESAPHAGQGGVAIGANATLALFDHHTAPSPRRP